MVALCQKERLFFLSLLLCFPSAILTAHFRGVYLSWQFVAFNHTTNVTQVTINVQQTYWWIYTRYLCGPIIGDPNLLICLSLNCSNYVNTMLNLQGSCTSFDASLDLAVGERNTQLTLNAGYRFAIGFQSAAWFPLLSGLSLNYAFATLTNLIVRSDNERINSSPITTMAPFVTVLSRAEQMLNIPVFDVDSDIVKCRWASNSTIVNSKSINECGGVCRNIPGAQLLTSSNQNNDCTVIFNGTTPGYYVLALQIEDFMPSAPNSAPLSSIPLQILIRVVNVSCNPPTIQGDFTSGAVVMIAVNKTFTTSIFSRVGCNSSAISRFWWFIRPNNQSNISSVSFIHSSIYSINLTWIPQQKDIDSKTLSCVVAIDTFDLVSTQYCFTLFVVSFIPTTAVPMNNPSVNHFPTKLIWILSWCIPLAFIVAILCACFACQCHKSGWWRDSCRRYKKQQEVNDRSEETIASSSDSVVNIGISETEMVETANKSVSPMRTNSMAVTHTSFLSSRSNFSLPNIEKPTSPTPPRPSQEPADKSHRKSILISKYLEQTGKSTQV